MSVSLQTIPVKNREIVFVIKDQAEKLKFYAKAAEGIIGLKSDCRPVTPDELIGLTSDAINEGDCLIWDEYYEKYLKMQDDLAKSECNRYDEFIRFCKNFLGAVKAEVHSETKVAISEKKEGSVSGNVSVPGKKLGGEVKGKSENENKEEKLQKNSFERTKPIPFNPKTAQEYYEKHHLSAFDEFKAVFLFRVDGEQECFTRELFYYHKDRQLIQGALDLKAELAKTGFALHVDFKKEEDQEFSKKQVISVWF